MFLFSGDIFIQAAKAVAYGNTRCYAALCKSTPSVGPMIAHTHLALLLWYSSLESKLIMKITGVRIQRGRQSYGCKK